MAKNNKVFVKGKIVNKFNDLNVANLEIDTLRSKLEKFTRSSAVVAKDRRIMKEQREEINKFRKALESVQESFDILFSEDNNPIPQNSIAMGVLRGIFLGVPEEVKKALKNK